MILSWLKESNSLFSKWDSLFTETLKRLPAQTNKQNLGPMYSSGIIQKHSSRQMTIGPWKGRPCEAQWLCFACFAEDSSLEDMPVQSSRETSAQPQPQILVFAHDVLINLWSKATSQSGFYCRVVNLVVWTESSWSRLINMRLWFANQDVMPATIKVALRTSLGNLGFVVVNE